MLIHKQSGTSMIEVLVSIVIVVLGLLGLAGLQSHASLGEAEAYQRAQAVILSKDMVDRINANRFRAPDFATDVVQGTGLTVEACALKSGAERDLCEWSNALLGAAETRGSDKVGAMPEARGCITLVEPNMPLVYEVAVVWQGATPTRAPSTTCGAGLYGDDRFRRAVVTRVRVGCLMNNPANNTCVFPQ
jgi:type IV pilus assembly protein PilV